MKLRSNRESNSRTRLASNGSKVVPRNLDHGPHLKDLGRGGSQVRPYVFLSGNVRHPWVGLTYAPIIIKHEVSVESQGDTIQYNTRRNGTIVDVQEASS